MAEYKVLGASDRNLKAIEMALSMGGCKSVNGEVIPDFHYKEEKVETVKQENLNAFKLSIKEKEGQSFLSIDKGTVFVYATFAENWTFWYSEEAAEIIGGGHGPIPLSGYFNDDLEHIVDVVVLVQTEGNFNYFSLFFATEINSYPDGPGMKHYVLGTLVRDSQNKWTVYSQNISSDIHIRESEEKDFPFKIWLKRNGFGNDLNMSLVSGAFDYNDYKFTVFGGDIYDPNGGYQVQPRDFPLSSNQGTVDLYLKYNYFPTSGEIMTYDELPSPQNTYRKIQIGSFSYFFGSMFSHDFSVSVTQKFSGNLNEGNPDQYIVKSSSGDTKPATLAEKIKGGRGMEIFTNYAESGGTYLSVSVSGATPLDSQILQRINALDGTGYIYFSNGQISLRTPSNNN